MIMAAVAEATTLILKKNPQQNTDLEQFVLRSQGGKPAVWAPQPSNQD